MCPTPDSSAGEVSAGHVHNIKLMEALKGSGSTERWLYVEWFSSF